MIQDISLTVYPVKDLARAKALYTKLLGVAPYADSPYYVGFRVGGHEVGLDPHGTQKLEYWTVADIRASVKTFTEAGAVVRSEVKDVGGGKLIATIEDADGNVIGLSQAC